MPVQRKRKRKRKRKEPRAAVRGGLRGSPPHQRIHRSKEKRGQHRAEKGSRKRNCIQSTYKLVCTTCYYLYCCQQQNQMKCTCNIPLSTCALRETQQQAGRPLLQRCGRFPSRWLSRQCGCLPRTHKLQYVARRGRLCRFCKQAVRNVRQE